MCLKDASSTPNATPMNVLMREIYDMVPLGDDFKFKEDDDSDVEEDNLGDIISKPWNDDEEKKVPFHSVLGPTLYRVAHNKCRQTFQMHDKAVNI